MEDLLKDAYTAAQREFYELKFGFNDDEMAERIMTAANSAIASIENSYLKKPDHVGPLFVMLGETHTCAAHIIAGMMIVKGLHAKGYKLSVGLEKPYNRAETGLAYRQHNNIGGGHTAILSRQMQAWNKYSPEFLRVADGIYVTSRTPLSEKIRNDACINNQISLTCNDAAMDNYNLSDQLDMTDKNLQRVLREEKMGMQEQAVNARSPRGIYLRNRVMMLLMQEHARVTRPDIYIQICGNTHVAGALMAPQGYRPYHQSLTGLLTADGNVAIGIPLFGAGFNQEYMPNEASDADIQGVVLEGPEFDGESAEPERAWLNEVMPHIMVKNGNHLPSFAFDR